jgi:carbonic anhydrase
MNALQRLKAGNARFVSDQLLPRDYHADRHATKHGQQPYAIVVTCGDSRVAPELLFDETIGRLFVIRVAGNVIEPVGLGGIELAAQSLQVDTLLIMGHDQCVAVAEALSGRRISPNIDAFAKRIVPVLVPANGSRGGDSETLNQTVRANVRFQMDQALSQSAILADLVEQNRFQIAGAVYHASTGIVEFL